MLLPMWLSLQILSTVVWCLRAIACRVSPFLTLCRCTLAVARAGEAIANSSSWSLSLVVQQSTIFHIKVIITHQPKTHHEAYALAKKTYVSMTMALDDAHIKDDAVKRHCFSLSPYISQGYTNHEIRHMAGLVLTQQFELIFQGCPFAIVNLRKRMRQIL